MSTIRLALPLCFSLVFTFAVKAAPKVVLGMERVFTPPYAAEFANKSAGLIAHNASRDSKGRHLADILRQSGTIRLKRIFSPEHGFRGVADSDVPDYTDPKTGLPVISLYGPRKAPEPKHLKDLDLLLIDLQDVGVRYYTYSTTMALAMQAAKREGVRVVVLDRPNPIGGEVVDGAVLEPSLQGNFEAFYPVATRHGMTMGELAILYNNSFGIGADLEVVPMKGWERGMRWPQTGLEWISPSPALPTYPQAELYAAFGALETFPLAVGRSVSNRDAFKVYGAPWISETKAKDLVSRLKGLKLESFGFEYVEWTPDRREYQGRLCRGFRVVLRDQYPVKNLDPFIRSARVMKSVLNRPLAGNRSARALGADWLAQGIENLTNPRLLLEQAEASRETFERQREASLIYR